MLAAGPIAGKAGKVSKLIPKNWRKLGTSKLEDLNQLLRRGHAEDVSIDDINMIERELMERGKAYSGYKKGRGPDVYKDQEIAMEAYEQITGKAHPSRIINLENYQQGGQVLPRKQQEIRNPQVYGPPVPANMDSLLNAIMMRNVNQSINPLTGDTINTVLDSIRLKQQMDKSKMPRTGRKKMRQGGPVMYANGGQLGAGQRLERTYGEQDLQQVSGESPGGYFPLAGQTEPDALLGTIRSDRRIKPLQPDKYTYRPSLPTHFDESRLSHPFHQEEVEEVPKLSTAYLASFGMETPLSKRQQALLFRKGIAPQTLNPQVKGLINRALVQRLTNEDD